MHVEKRFYRLRPSVAGEKRFYSQEDKAPIRSIGFILFVLGIALALVTTVWSLYIRGFLTNDAHVGLVNSFLLFISFLAYFFIIPLIEKSDKYKLVIKMLVLIAIGYFLYFFVNSIYLFLLIAVMMAVIGPIRISATGLLIRHNSSRANLSKNEGFIFSLFNLSFLIGPLLGGFLLAFTGIRSLFLVAAVMFIASIFVLKYSKIDHGGIKKRVDKKVFKNFAAFFKKKERTMAYFLGMGVPFWWSMIYIFLPLHIVKELSTSWVGIFLALVTVPLISLEYFFGKKAGKKGYKKLFFIGFLIPAAISLISFFFYSNIYFIMSAIILASFGLAMVESNSESYFFDILKGKQDQRFFSIYNTSAVSGSILGQLIFSLVLLALPFRYVFLVYFVAMLAFAILSLSVKKVIEEKRKR
jgi:MFS family permease